MNDMKQPEALRLADALSRAWQPTAQQAAAELRRLHEQNSVLTYTLTAYKSASESLASEQAENELLEQQCDELLDALKDCLEKGSRWHPCDPVVAKANAAIAKAIGEQA